MTLNNTQGANINTLRKLCNQAIIERIEYDHLHVQNMGTKTS